MKERVISQSSRLQRNRPSNCDWCNGADRQRTLFAFRCTHTRHTRASPRRINPICLLIRARNVERSFDQIFFSPPLSGCYYYLSINTPFIFRFRTEKESNEKIREKKRKKEKKRKGDEGMDPPCSSRIGIGLCCFAFNHHDFQVKCWRRKPAYDEGEGGRKSETPGWMGH